MPADNMARLEGGHGDTRACANPQQLALEVDALGVEIIPPVENLPAEIPIESIENARLPASYKRATTALNRCLRVDEAKDWADKAEAIAAYARMSRDEVLMKTALRIKSRAMKRCGELLKTFDARGGDRKSEEIKKADTDRFDQSRSEAGRRAGMSDRQVKDAVRLANVPRETFEEMVESDDPPTVTKLAEIGKASKPGHEKPKTRQPKAKKKKPFQLPTRPDHLNSLYLWIRTGGDLARKFSSAAEAMSLAAQHNVDLSVLDTSLEAVTEFLVDLREAARAGRAEADRRLDELGYQGPRSSFAEEHEP